MVRTLEVPQSTGNETENLPETQDESQVEDTDNSDTAGNDDENTVEVDPTIQLPELTPEEKIEAYIRKEQVLREAQSEKNNLENTVISLRREINDYKKPLAEAIAKVERLISCDVSGFLKWEKEQELPLLRKAEEEANAWRNCPVESLDVTEKDKEKLAEHFTTCGSVADWLGKDFAEKKTGLNGEKTKDRLRDAINKISGNQA